MDAATIKHASYCKNPGRWKKQRNSAPRIKLDTTLNDENA
jgi:hypothetical protein